METVGIRELKNRLSAYLHRVGEGEIIVVTDRGRVVAEIMSPGLRALQPGPVPALVVLAQRDGLRLPVRSPDRLVYGLPLPQVDLGGQSIGQLLDMERREP
jgi:prevent-host-death family protein